MPGISGETASWEDSQLTLIAEDHDLLQAFQNLKYVNVALLAILVYDHCLTFDIERERIWTLRWRLPKFLFMINRYFLPPIFFFDGLTNVLHVGKNICNARIFTPIPAFPAIMTVELLLMLRVLALYGNSKHMARYLVFQFFFQIIAMTITALLILPETRSIPGRDVFAGCLLAIPDWAYWSWVQPLVVEIILVVLSFYQCRKYGSFSPTHKILARDSIIYFVSITSGLIFNLVYGRRHVLLGTAMTMPTSVLASIAAARLSMNIRSITMEQGFSTLAQQTHLTTIFQLRTRPEVITSSTREVFSSDDIEEELVETLQQDDDHNQDQSLGPVQLYGVRELPKFN